jgi:hypothetical protein
MFSYNSHWIHAIQQLMVIGGVVIVVCITVAVGIPLLLQCFVGWLTVFGATPFESRHLQIAQTFIYLSCIRDWSLPRSPYPVVGVLDEPYTARPAQRSIHRVGRVLSFSQVVGIGTPTTLHPQASVPLRPGSGGFI